jgi:hypothetical protein
MTSITLSDLFTIIFVIVDDRYKQYGIKLLKGKPGAKPIFTDIEVITLMLAQEFIPFPSETQFIGFICANYLELFPELLKYLNRHTTASGHLNVKTNTNKILPVWING